METRKRKELFATLLAPIRAQHVPWARGAVQSDQNGRAYDTLDVLDRTLPKWN